MSTDLADRESARKLILRLNKWTKSNTDKQLVRETISKHKDKLLQAWSKFEIAHQQVLDRCGEKALPFENIEYETTSEVFNSAVSHFDKLFANCTMDGKDSAKGINRNDGGSAGAACAKNDDDDDSSEIITKYDRCVRVFESAKVRIEKVQLWLENNSGDTQPTVQSIKVQLDHLESFWVKCVSIHDESIQDIPRDKCDEFEVMYDAAEDSYLNSKIKLNDLLSETEHIPSKGDVRVRLPRIELPKFAGVFTLWTSFRDQFTSVVHEANDLSNAQKLHYLKSCLRGEAESLVRSFQITDENYEIAWSTLVERYEQTRLVVNAHVKNIFDLTTLRAESASSLRQLIDSANDSVRMLHSLGQPTGSWDTLLVYLLVHKMDPDTQREWELSLGRNEMPTFDDLLRFVENRCRSLQAVCIAKSQSSNKQFTSSADGARKSNAAPKAFHAVSNPHCQPCVVCTKQHLLFSCPDFEKLDLDHREEIVSKHKLCRNCLKGNHVAARCYSRRCRLCDKEHHTSLHRDESKVTANVCTESSEVFLPTAMVRVKSADGGYLLMRALVDSGSQSSFITERCAQLLKLTRSATSVPISGVGQTKRRATGRVRLSISPRFGNSFELSFDALCLKKISGSLPGETIHIMSNYFQDIQLADPGFFKSGPIDLLLGADVFGSIMKCDRKERVGGQPSVQDTHLGWVVVGVLNTNGLNHQSFTVLIESQKHTELEVLLRRFWEIEDLPKADVRTSEEKECERIYSETTTRDNDGRYVVHLPFKPNGSTLGNSRNMAVSSLLQLERRLKSKPELRREYNTFMRDYEDMHHMQKANIGEVLSGKHFYLPHLAVITDKIRVVFDASRKSTSSVSLNDRLMVGPRLQEGVAEIVLRFRRHRIAFTSDVVKMYRQILVTPEHQDYQRIVWRPGPENELREYRLTTVTYGTSSAPFLAIRTLLQLAKDIEHKYPAAAEVIRNDFYVDDVMTGADDVRSAINIQIELKSALASGGFPMSKWAANNPQLLVSVDPKDRQVCTAIEFEETGYVKTLGLFWMPKEDEFRFRVSLPENENPVTKRHILSDVSKLFDPLGLLAPVIIKAKIFLQRLWVEKCDWDDTVDERIANEWLVYRNELPKLQDVRIPRWLGTKKDITVQLHGFCDASEHAYCAVVYLVGITEMPISVSLITSKSKVSPIQQLSIPRLELCGAHLLAKLMTSVRETLGLKDANVYLWTDSELVLKWLLRPPATWKTFVANRVSQIQELFPNITWRHVPSAENPADCGSRGLNPSEIVSHHLWWFGPEWLLDNARSWPAQKNLSKTIDDSDAGLEPRQIVSSLIAEVASPPPDNVLQSYSSIRKLKRIVALLQRFTYNCRQKDINKRRTGQLTTMELRNAFETCVRVEQQAEFGDEIRKCATGKDLQAKSKLASLAPFVDDRGILRVGGRCRASSFPEDFKHQIILPNKSNLTILLLAEIHQTTLHGSVQLMLATLRQRYWIVSARKEIAMYVRRCVRCLRFRRSAMNQQKMGDLPVQRISPTRPFLISGVDFAGPILIKSTKLKSSRGIKAYVALFVCFATKGVHLELVGDLTSSAFIAAYRRFCARRGVCAELHSDRGTNFVGADRELQRIHIQTMDMYKHPDVIRQLADDGTNWIFIPPGSPTFGGLWESGVKSAKHHIRRVLGSALLTFEELTTVLCQVEACLNSRPICAMTEDPDDYEALTPGHFLVGEAINSIPDCDVTHCNSDRLTRWQRVQQATQHIWNRWKNEYIPTLQQRRKWVTATENVKVGDLALVTDEQLPPTQWPLGRVIEVYPGPDGSVRVAKVRLARGSIFKRTIRKLCVLPTNDSTN